MNFTARLFGAGAVIALISAITASTALGSATINSFSTTISTSQAGGHPDIKTSFTLAAPGAPESARNVIFNGPQGVFGNPGALTRCTSSDFAQQACPSSSQVGLITIRANYESDPNFLMGTAPIYNLEPGPNTALFGLIVPILDLPINIPVGVRTGGDYGLRFTVSNITQLVPLAGADLTFWGFPTDPANDDERFPKGSLASPAGCPNLADASCISAPTSAALPVRPFTDNPTTCPGNELPTTLTVQTYQDPANPTHAFDSYPPITDCEKETFNPVMFVNPTSHETDSASGLDIQLRAPQFLGLAASPSEIRSAIVTLPDGLTINPDAADGQNACTDAEANFGSEDAANCPDSSKIGTIGIHSTALEGTLNGSLYFGEPKPADQYRILMIADGFGMHAKLVGSAKPDARTGQVTVHFIDLPQVPFDIIDLHLFASDRGLLATPISCTIYTATGVFFPWNGTIAPVTSRSNFSIDSGPGGGSCPGQVRPFHPRLAAGTTNSLAGAFSSFKLKLDRDDGDQYLGDLKFRMPPGFTGDLRGIAYCPESSILAAANNLGRLEQANASCPANSQIGTTNVAAGPGSHAFHAVGKMYLSGPFKGAPLSLAAVTPALAGPYDYGVVVVRVALNVDPLTAQVSAVSDTVPSIIGGVPIRMRSIQVNIDKQNFTINPTNCSNFTVDSQGIGDQGTVTDFSSFFHVDNCAALGFKPKMSVRQVGKKGTRRTQNPELKFDLKTRTGDANIKSLSVTLPSAFAIDQRHLGNICSEKELAEKQCAGRTPIGKASTTTPLLDQPLEGPVYAVSGSGGLPKLAFILKGQVNLVPRAETETISKGGAGLLSTTVPVVPDAPIGHFALTVFGGKTGYLVNTRSLCVERPTVKIEYTAQSGKNLTQKTRVKTACKGGKKRPARRGRHAAR
jgi:hypothetical protein